MKQQKGLGRGLEAIFSSEKIETKMSPMSATAEIAIDKIKPNPAQPRANFAEEMLAELAASIKELGVIQPVTLRQSGAGRYEIISGERRWRASKLAGLTTIPAYVREVDDTQMHTMALVENLQREDLNPIEIALGLQRLLDECSLTQDGMAQRLSMKRSTISNYLRLLKMCDEVQYALKQGFVTMGHAKAIASVEGVELQQQLLKRVIDEALSVRACEALAQKMNTPQEEAKEEPKKALPKGLEALSNHLNGIFPKGVSVKTNSRGGGKIVINYTNQSELQQLVEELEIGRE